MKLRLRSLESKETHKIEVPDSWSLQQLKDSLSRAISSSSSSSSSSLSLHLSLNRKDEIQASSQNESLHSIGIASGDLIFYTLNPNAFSLETLVHKPGPSQIEPSDPILQETQNQSSTEGQMEVPEVDTTDDLPESEQPAFSESMEIAEASVYMIGKSDSEPSFVKRVLREALENDRNDHKLMVVAVHAVMLESGFVLLDKVSGMTVGCSHVLDEWTSKTSTLSLRYTLPEILANASDATETVVLKFQSLGHLVNVYGSLSAGGSGLHRVCLDKCKFAPALEVMLQNSDSNVSSNTGDDHHDSEVFQLWKMVKDGLALPLLIDLCEKAGLGPPPCFMCLPTDLKMKILEYLDGVDIAKVACLCSEMRYLSSNNELWKQKFEEEFGEKKSRIGWTSYKVWFAQSWVKKKMTIKPLVATVPNITVHVHQPHNHAYYRVRRDPNPFFIPSIWGGDYDRLPRLGVPSSYRRPGIHIGIQIPAFQQRRRFSPACDLLE